MRAGQQFHWDSEQQASFEDLKAAFVSGDISVYPKDEVMFILVVDASDTGVGGCLSQMHYC